MPDIFTNDTWGKWLPDSVVDAKVEDGSMVRDVNRAERKLIGRYTEHEPGTEAVRQDTHGAGVRIIDWEEKEDGTPDVSAMPDDLVTRLRDCIARIIQEWHEMPEDNVQSVSQGSKSVTYFKEGGSLPRSVWIPLRPYDDRTPYSPGV